MNKTTDFISLNLFNWLNDQYKEESIKGLVKEKIQITALYCFVLALVSFITHIHISGSYPNLIPTLIPFGRKLIHLPTYSKHLPTYPKHLPTYWNRYLLTPFFLTNFLKARLSVNLYTPGLLTFYHAVLAVFIRRNIFRLNILMRFNILLLLILELVQTLLNLFYQFIFVPEDIFIRTNTVKPKLNSVVEFRVFIFLIFYALLFYFYVKAIQGKFPRVSSNKIYSRFLQKIFDSVAFSLKGRYIKT